MSHDAARDRARADLMAQLAGQVDPEAIRDIDPAVRPSRAPLRRALSRLMDPDRRRSAASAGE